MGSLSIWHWLIVLVVVMLIFGTGKIKNIGRDLGEAVKGFKEGMKDNNSTSQEQTPPTSNQSSVPASHIEHSKTAHPNTIEVKATEKDK